MLPDGELDSIASRKVCRTIRNEILSRDDVQPNVPMHSIKQGKFQSTTLV
jgi:hypothetical protein